MSLNLNMGKPSIPAAPTTNKPVIPEVAMAPAAEKPEEIEPAQVMYSSYPLESFQIGTRWRFEKSVLKVSADEAKLIDAYLLKADSRTKQLVRKIDVNLAEARVRELTRSQATKSIGSEVGHEGTMVTQVGTEAIDAPKDGQE